MDGLIFVREDGGGLESPLADACDEGILKLDKEVRGQRGDGRMF